MAESKQQVDLGVIKNEAEDLLIPWGERNTSPDIQLRPWIVDPEPSEADIEELKRLRAACGWDSERIPVWKEEVQSGAKCIWFIHLRIPTGLSEPIGMVSLCLYDPSDLTLANLRAPPSQAGDRVEGGGLFIYPQYRRRGIAGAAIREMERKAAELGANVVTTNTMALSEKVPRYERMGYRQYKTEKKYILKDMLALGFSDEHCYAAFLEKKIAYTMYPRPDTMSRL